MTPTLQSRSITREEASQIVSEAKKLWRDTLSPNAPELLHQNPHLNLFQSLVLDLAYEHYCLAEAQGQSLSSQEFEAQFPACQSLIRELLAEHRYCVNNPSLFARIETLFPPGHELDGGFVVERIIGQGAFAHVYLERQTHANGRRVVIKYGVGQSQEGSLLARYEHDHIVPIYHAWKERGNSAIAMPFYGTATLDRVIVHLATRDQPPQSGCDLLEAIACCQMTEDNCIGRSEQSFVIPGDTYEVAVAKIATALVDVLSFLMEKGVCHADVKPANILLDPNGFPYLLDFNLAVVSSHDSREIRGTPAYLAPELLASAMGHELPCDANQKSEQYSIGLTMLHLLTLKHPYLDYDQNTTQPTVAQLLEHIKTVSQNHCLVEAQPSRLRSLLIRASAFHPASRFASLSEFYSNILVLPEKLKPRVAPDQYRDKYAWRMTGVVAALMIFLGSGFLLLRSGIGFEQLNGEVRSENFLQDGLRHLRTNDLAGATNALLKSYRQNKDASAAAALAYISAKEKIFSEAITYSKIAIEHGTSDWSVHNNLGYAYFHSRQYDNAMVHANQAVRANPNQAKPYCLLGISAYAKYKRIASEECIQIAQTSIDHACTLQPNNPVLLYYAALFRLDRPKVTDAQRTEATRLPTLAMKCGLSKVKVVKQPVFRNSLAKSDLKEFEDLPETTDPIDKEFEILAEPVVLSGKSSD